LVLGVFGAGFELDHGEIHLLAELTLILVLFLDAARINPTLLVRDHNLPLRLLIVGMPLSIVFATWVGQWVVPELMLFEAALARIIHEGFGRKADQG
jgi:NhaP-type Na+/H+ or K+/H+ antiporter